MKVFFCVVHKEQAHTNMYNYILNNNFSNSFKFKVIYIKRALHTYNIFIKDILINSLFEKMEILSNKEQAKCSYCNKYINKKSIRRHERGHAANEAKLKLPKEINENFIELENNSNNQVWLAKSGKNLKEKISESEFEVNAHVKRSLLDIEKIIKPLLHTTTIKEVEDYIEERCKKGDAFKCYLNKYKRSKIGGNNGIMTFTSIQAFFLEKISSNKRLSNRYKLEIYNFYNRVCKRFFGRSLKKYVVLKLMEAKKQIEPELATELIKYLASIKNGQLFLFAYLSLSFGLRPHSIISLTSPLIDAEGKFKTIDEKSNMIVSHNLSSQQLEILKYFDTKTKAINLNIRIFDSYKMLNKRFKKIMLENYKQQYTLGSLRNTFANFDEVIKFKNANPLNHQGNAKYHYMKVVCTVFDNCVNEIKQYIDALFWKIEEEKWEDFTEKEINEINEEFGELSSYKEQKYLSFYVGKDKIGFACIKIAKKEEWVLLDYMLIFKDHQKKGYASQIISMLRNQKLVLFCTKKSFGFYQKIAKKFGLYSCRGHKKIFEEMFEKTLLSNLSCLVILSERMKLNEKGEVNHIEGLTKKKRKRKIK